MPLVKALQMPERYLTGVRAQRTPVRETPEFLELNGAVVRVFVQARDVLELDDAAYSGESVRAAPGDDRMVAATVDLGEQIGRAHV